MTEYAWVPTPEAIEHANVTRFMRAHGAADIDELRAKSVADVDWFWDAVIKDLGLPFTRPVLAPCATRAAGSSGRRGSRTAASTRPRRASSAGAGPSRRSSTRPRPAR